MNAIDLLEHDHREVEAIFAEMEKLNGGKSNKTKQRLCEKLVRELSIHSAIEEMIFYPEVKKASAAAKGLVLESLEEHHVVKWELDAISSMKVDDERFDAKLKVLKDIVSHHVDEEENQLFPVVRRLMNAAKLENLGRRLEQAKKIAPTRPHPRAPDQPPGNVMTGLGASVVDRTMDAARAFVRGDGRRSRAKVATSRSHDGDRPSTRRKPARATRTRTTARTHRAHAR